MFVVCNVAKCTAKPTQRHWKAVKHILRYLVGTVNYEILYRRSNSTDCIGYTDSDWAGDIDD